MTEMSGFRKVSSWMKDSEELPLSFVVSTTHAVESSILRASRATRYCIIASRIGLRDRCHSIQEGI